MNRFATLAFILLATAPASAQPVAPAPSAAQVADPHLSVRITQMHRLLKITPEQEPAWDAFATIMRDNAASTSQAIQHRRAAIATMSPVDNLKNVAQIELARAQGLQNLAYSFETLYGTFSDDQKKAAEAMFAHYKDASDTRRHEPRKPR